jgi:hypothetical protein
VLRTRPLLILAFAGVAGLAAAGLTGWQYDARQQAAAADRVHALATGLTLPANTVSLPLNECEQPDAQRCLHSGATVDRLSADLFASLGRQSRQRPKLACEDLPDSRTCTLTVDVGRHQLLVTLIAIRGQTLLRSRRSAVGDTLIAVRTS